MNKDLTPAQVYSHIGLGKTAVNNVVIIGNQSTHYGHEQSDYHVGIPSPLTPV